MKEITTNIFPHRTNGMNVVDVVTNSLYRALGIAEILEAVGSNQDQIGIDIERAIQAIRYEIVDAIALLTHYQDDLHNRVKTNDLNNVVNINPE
ncbi:hypothetical protein [Methylomonas sp. MgM2]